ncbi:MAG: hypothetical protein ACP5JG_06530 [Anaerolineae bacterium]
MPYVRSSLIHLALAVILIAPTASIGATHRPATTPTLSTSPAEGATAVSSGGSHTCGLTEQGGVKCWGGNWYGQLGDDTSDNRSVPDYVVGLTSGVAALSLGATHTCALTDQGAVKCWGANEYGQLGDGTTENRHTPVSVSGLTRGIVAIAAGEHHTCALTSQGGVQCWGRNDVGELGDGTTTERHTPVDVVGLSGTVAAIAAGGWHACALIESGGVQCWGWNEYGQLGDGTTDDAHTPQDVLGIAEGGTSVDAGRYHACAITTEGGLKCWGRNDYAQLGDGTREHRYSAVSVVGMASDTTAVTTGPIHTCAQTANGIVKCWGDNTRGKLGDGTTENRTTPVDVTGLSTDTVIVDAGYNHSCALTAQGAIKCWGANFSGQLGNGIETQQFAPVDVRGFANAITALSTGAFHNCAITDQGGVQCWGLNWAGQLGDGTTDDRSTPVGVEGLSTGISSLDLGSTHSCALTIQGGVKCWGGNEFGKLGDGTTEDRHTPVDVVGLTSGVTSVTAGSSHSCAVTDSGSAKCWGGNEYGQLGDGTAETRHTPVDVQGLSAGVRDVAAGYYHSCALTTGGDVKCWGRNDYGQLGNGTTENSTTPVNVTGLNTGVVAIITGYFHTCALTEQGAVKCWGFNDDGQLGDGTTVDRDVPVSVVGLSSDASWVATTAFHTCAVEGSGGAKCWGWNPIGALGDGTTEYRTEPVGVQDLSSGVLSVTPGWQHTCALTEQGAAKCWGSNNYGQLGDGTPMYELSPVDALFYEGPAPVTMLEVRPDKGADEVHLFWFEPLWGTKSPVTYTVRYSTTPIESESSWSSAIDVSGEPTPRGSDWPQSMSVSGLSPGQMYYFAIRSQDAAGNWSPLSNSPGIVASAYRPNPQGYGFDNGTLPGPSWEIFRDTFGADNVEWTIGGKTIRKPVAWYYYRSSYDGGTDDGSCSGMSTSSALLFRGLADPADFLTQQGVTQTISLSDPVTNTGGDWIRDPVVDFVVRYQGYQLGKDVTSARANAESRTVTETLEILKTSIDGNLAAPQVIDVFGSAEPNYNCGGHTVLPYAYTAYSETTRIFVYDPNDPESTHSYLEMNPKANRWSYDHGGALGTWQSDRGCRYAWVIPSSSSLAVMPLSLWQERPEPPWLGGGATLAADSAGSSIYLEYSVATGASLLIVDAQGRAIGARGGRLVDELPGAIAVIPAASVPGVEPEYPETYAINATAPMTAYVQYAEATSVPVSAIIPNGVVEVTGVAESAGITDTVNIAPQRWQIAVKAGSSAGDRRIRVVKESEDAGHQLTIGGFALAGGEAIDVNASSLEDGTFVVTSSQSQDGYEIGLTQIGATSTIFRGTGPAMEPGDIHTFRLDWGDPASAQIEVDRGGDGSIDETSTIQNSVLKVFLPLVSR